ncbi:methylenetetrahydrofolate reductase [Methylomarinum sp. Ch1-1]|uniref:Methylenetetrahydrofolate reductase n=1 Tax=Methylomarinum roseum TaxID=3067653 RepID=A0AAU7NVZ0_9GAMM|nr:methylenetetrahydrofolate reductase [Methylomarinum sp. Ch1-1]MDP4522773.1 methylenetetrahydrofolate reductase [Methylomarinum sp. Ch1-1]
MKISFEIVPRSKEAFAEQYRFVQSLGPSIDLINVPDIQRFTIRSWETIKHIDRSRHQFIPHLRAIDFDIKSGEIFKIIEEYQLDNVLLVSGDPPEGLKRSFYKTNVLDLIRAVKQQFPDINVYAGFDSHRNGVQDECNYIKHKADAGVCGFFSQPFYDIRMIEIYAEQMQGLETFIGLSPITTEASMKYWEVKNKVQFPADFRCDYPWNIDFANRAIKLAHEAGMNIYFMPIRIDLEKYFGQLELSQS